MSGHKYIAGSTAVNIATSIEAAVAAGRIAPATQLPPIRELASNLEVSPATVAAAYALLRRRGLVVAAGRRGTAIRPFTPDLAPPQPEMRIEGLTDLASGDPDPDLLPRLERFARTLRIPHRTYGGETNVPELAARARDWMTRDGIPSSPITIVSGALDGVERVLREHLRPGDRVAVEDPCFSGVLDVLASLGLVPEPVPVDVEGMLPAGLSAALRRSRAMVITPRAQNPTGAALTARRARELKSVLSAHPDALLVEDDHAGPVSGSRAFTLADSRMARWAVIRSVSKFLGPDLRVAFMAGDPTTLHRVESRQVIGIRWVSHVLQQLTLAVWSDPGTARLLSRAEAAYTARRTSLLEALEANGIEAHGASGLNVWIPVREEAATMQALASCGWAVRAGERFRLRSGPAIRVTVSRMTKADARRFAGDLQRIVHRRRSAAGA